MIDKIRGILFDDDEVRVVASAPDRPNIAYVVRHVLSVMHASRKWSAILPARSWLSFEREARQSLPRAPCGQG